MAIILLVHDDPFQASSLKSTLEERFSNVLRVRDAAEALCLVEQRWFTAELGLVISGHHSFGLGGPEFVAEIRDRLPNIKVVVVGNRGESSKDYAGRSVGFLPAGTATEDLIDEIGDQLEDRHRAAA